MQFGKRNMGMIIKLKEIMLFIPLLIWTLIFYFIFTNYQFSLPSLIFMISFAAYFIGSPLYGILRAHSDRKRHERSKKEFLEVNALTLFSVFLGLLIVIVSFFREDAFFGGGYTGIFLASLMAISGTFGTYSLIRGFICWALRRFGKCKKLKALDSIS